MTSYMRVLFEQEQSSWGLEGCFLPELYRDIAWENRFNRPKARRAK